MAKKSPIDEGRPSARDEGRVAADAMAQALAEPEVLRALRLAQAGAVVGQRDSTPAKGSAGGRGPRPISIWQPRESEGRITFERPPRLPLGDHYAARRVLNPKRDGGPTRVAFFGESVAAGYLYAPHLTPAEALEHQLCAVSGAGSYEVIDLARTDERPESMARTVEASLQLEPDVLVLFAGNNWNLLCTPEISPYAPQQNARQRYGVDLRTGGIEGPLERALQTQGRTVAQAWAAIAEQARERSLPVVVLIPEVNLADWENRQPVMWLPGDDTAEWWDWLERGRAALERGDGAQAEAAAQRMLDLDGGAGPTAFRLLALARVAEGSPGAARSAALAEVDASAYPTMACLDAPRATTAARRIARFESMRHGFSTVDLREVFADRPTGQELPGRDLFLDYCHLTSDGIHRAMAAVSHEILAQLEPHRSLPSRAELSASLPPPEVSSEVEAVARLGAAVHTAHRLLSLSDKRAKLRAWCRDALRASSGVRDAMVNLVAARASRLPAVMSAGQTGNLESAHRLELAHGWRWDYADADVVDAVRSALAEVGEPLPDDLEEQWVSQHAPQEQGLDLAAGGFYLAEPLERFYPDLMDLADLPGRAVTRAPFPTTEFVLVAPGDRAMELELSARLPAISGAEGLRSGAVGLSIDGQEIGRLDLAESWRRGSVRIDSALLPPGDRRIELRWPRLPACGDAAREGATKRLEEGLEGMIHPVFGEIFSLRATPA